MEQVIFFNKNIFRIYKFNLFADFIKINNEYIRVGTFPEISKTLKNLNLLGSDKYVILPKFKINLSGDNYTGEEFILWNSIFDNEVKRYYIGRKKDLNFLYEKLLITIPGDFNKEKTKIVLWKWLDDYFVKMPLKNKVIRFHKFSIKLEKNNIYIYNANNKLIYELKKVNSILKNRVRSFKVHYNNKLREDKNYLILAGAGNGFYNNSSSFLFVSKKNKLWIDPLAYSNYHLKNLKLKWTKNDAVVLSHNHEDHYAGISALWYYCKKNKFLLKIITTKLIFHILKKQYSIVKDFEKHIKFIELKPLKKIKYFNYEILSRLNHHVLLWGTLGFKIYINKKCIGISGDTKYSEKINKVLNRKELTYKWFRECDLIFHEVSKPSRYSVHTYIKDINHLKNKLKKNIILYHTILKYKGYQTAKDYEIFKI